MTDESEASGKCDSPAEGYALGLVTELVGAVILAMQSLGVWILLGSPRKTGVGLLAISVRRLSYVEMVREMWLEEAQCYQRWISAG